ncbi:MAG: AAA family ATPase [Gallionella sp.]|nr:AAA family ATPase [Gallionella sp.]MDD4958588.1 AAA family ATPase [Gallionella sp.]
MRIDWLKIPDDRNLKNFEINFEETVPISVLLGRNGSGKSNLIENLVEIFRALESAAPVERFAYEIQYYCHGHKIHVKADPHAKRESISFTVDGHKIAVAAFKKNARDYLPKYVFAYYSGWNNRLESLFSEPTKKYYQANLSHEDADAPRRFFFCRKDYANLALMALFFEKHELATYIREELLGIVSFDSALVVLKSPWWAKQGANRKDNSDDLFWGARGNFTEFMQRLRSAALAPIKNAETTEGDIRGRTQSTERLYLYIRDREHLEKLRAPYESPKLLFNHLESMYLSDLVEEIRVVGKRKDGGLVRFDQLSEGEQQLVSVFGLLLFTQSDEALYLLDEPDSHLNPRWTYEYRDMLRRALFPYQDGKQHAKESREVNPIDFESSPAMEGNSQVLIATHNPLMISAHPRTHVRILSCENGTTTAYPPEDEPPGMSIDRLLTSEVFGLDSALPPNTLWAISERERLAALPTRTKSEDKKLKQLSEELELAGLLRTYRLPEEKEFIEAMRRREQRSTIGLTAEEVKSRNERADALLEEIFSKKS